MASKFSSRLNPKPRNSDPDDYWEPIVEFNNTLEYAIFGLYRINVINLIKTKAALTKQFHISPCEVDNMMYWEYEIYMDALNDMVKEENEAQQSEMDKYNVNKYKSMSQNPNKMMPKMPDMSKMDMSRMKMPGV